MHLSVIMERSFSFVYLSSFEQRRSRLLGPLWLGERGCLRFCLACAALGSVIYGNKEALQKINLCLRQKLGEEMAKTSSLPPPSKCKMQMSRVEVKRKCFDMEINERRDMSACALLHIFRFFVSAFRSTLNAFFRMISE